MATPDARRPAEEIRETVLPSGAVVVTETVPHVDGVALGVWIGAGSRHEAEAEAGLTHFLEHLVFKGTATRSARDISEQVDAVGGSLDAGTGREHTAYVARVLAEHLPLACDLLGDLILRARLAEEDVALERGVVLDEIKAYEDEPSDLVLEAAAGALWGEDPLARPVLGRAAVVGAATGADLAAFRGRRYTAGRVLIAAAGRLRHEEIVARLGDIPAGLPAGAPDRAPGAPVARAGRRVLRRTQEQSHLAVAIPALPAGHPDRFALTVLNNILGGTNSSRLFQEVREARGLAYAAGSWLEGYRDAGQIVLHTATDPARFAEVAGVIAALLADLAAGGMTDAEVTRARDQLKGSLFLGLEGTGARMSRLAHGHLTLGRVTPLAEVMAMIEAVTPADVRRLAAELLRPERFATAILGPGPEAERPLPWDAQPVRPVPVAS